MVEELRKKGKVRKETKKVNGHNISSIDKPKQRMIDTSLPIAQMGQFDKTQVEMKEEDQPSKQDGGIVMTIAEESRKKGKARKEIKEVNGHNISSIDKPKQRMVDTSLPTVQMGQFDKTQVGMKGEDEPSKQE
ncbi:hypothetical protein V6N13_014712 [Hibiscus sabdariffa]